MSKPLVLRLQHAVCGSQLDSDTRHLVMVMALLADGKTGKGYASQATIAEAMGRSVRHVGDLVRALEANPDSPVGVSRTRRGSATGRSSDQYELFPREEAQRADSGTQAEQAPRADSPPAQEAQRAGSDSDPTGTPQQPNRQITTPEEAQRADDQRLISDLISDPSAARRKPRTPKGSRKKTDPKPESAQEAHQLKVHYVAEFKRHRDGIEPVFESWGRAMKAFGKLATMVGVEKGKALIGRALVPNKFVTKIQPWELVADANKWLTSAQSSNGVQRGGDVRETDAEYLAGFEL